MTWEELLLHHAVLRWVHYARSVSVDLGQTLDGLGLLVVTQLGLNDLMLLHPLSHLVHRRLIVIKIHGIESKSELWILGHVLTLLLLVEQVRPGSYVNLRRAYLFHNLTAV